MSIRSFFFRPTVIIVLLPLLVALPQIVGLLDADPLLRVGSMTLRVSRGLTDGGFAHAIPNLDPNDGFTTQALGWLAAWDWLHGIIPWWNPYSGVGLPLAGEYQPAAFFPLTLLQSLPRAMVLEHLALQIIAGLGTYMLLRHLRLAKAAATAGGVLFAFNGAIAWFGHAPAFPIPFLPWMLLGIERVYSGLPWRVFAIALALSLLAGFPETAYINGLLALLWAAVRCIKVARGKRLSCVGRLLLDGVVGLGLSAPQLIAFVGFLPYANLGVHTGVLADYGLAPIALVPSLIAPYVFGPLHGYSVGQPDGLTAVWQVGGYVGLPILCMAIYGLIRHRRALLAWALGAWVLLALGKTFGIQPITGAWNLIPGIAATAFPRYATSSWILALVILAAFGLDRLARTNGAGRCPVAVAGAITAAIMLASVAGIVMIEKHLHPSPSLRNWAVASLAWAAVITIAILAITYYRAGSLPAARMVSALLIADAAIMAFIPTLAYPASGRIDLAAIRFLQDNLGTYRFYTLGPIQANYGAYFRIASINHNYLPVAASWTDWVNANLDSAADPIIFNGNYQRLIAGQPSQAEELRRNLPAYEWVGVKYVVAPAGSDPFGAAANGASERPIQVYADRLLSIYQLPAPRPYFDIAAGDCTIPATTSRTRVGVDCRTAGVLVRRELFFPGWSAAVNGTPTDIHAHKELFQAVDIPTGHTTIVFDYAPPYIRWAWLTMAVAGLLMLPGVRLSRTVRRLRRAARVHG